MIVTFLEQTYGHVEFPFQVVIHRKLVTNNMKDFNVIVDFIEHNQVETNNLRVLKPSIYALSTLVPSCEVADNLID